MCVTINQSIDRHKALEWADEVECKRKRYQHYDNDDSNNKNNGKQTFDDKHRGPAPLDDVIEAYGTNQRDVIVTSSRRMGQTSVTSL